MTKQTQIQPKQSENLFNDLSADWHRDGITWRECSEEDYNEALYILPPERFTMSGFLMGEPFTHTRTDAVFATFVSIRGRFFAKYCEDRKADAESRALLIKLARIREADEISGDDLAAAGEIFDTLKGGMPCAR